MSQHTQILHRDYGATSSNAIIRNHDGTFSPSEFMHLSLNIAENIQYVKNSWQQLERMHKTIDINKNATDSQNEKIHNIQVKANENIQITSRDLSKLAMVVQKNDKKQKLQLEKLTYEFEITARKYSEIQKQIAKLMKELVFLATTQQHDENTNFCEDNDREELLQRQMEIQSVKLDIEMLLDREIRVREIEADILNVGEIMRELNILVHQQGDTLDTIEESVEHTASNVEGAATQLLEADVYRASYRKKFCILFVIVVIAALIIIGIVVWPSPKK